MKHSVMAPICKKLILALIIWFQLIRVSLSDCVTAPKALGMEHGVIWDSQLSASSEQPDAALASTARLNYQDKSWSPEVLDVDQWLQVDLKTDKVTLSSISTQGRQPDVFVTSYTISYRNVNNIFQDFTENGTPKIFHGNSDGGTIVTNHFFPPIEARFIRVNPKSWTTHIAMRIELFGCYHKDPWRWIISRGKPTTQSSTSDTHVASYATNGDFNGILAPMQYSQTTASSQPYLQIDFGKSILVDVVVFSMPILNPPKTYSAIFELKAGDGPTVGDTANKRCYKRVPSSWVYVICRTIGRYVTLQNMADSDELSISEIGVYKRTVESTAYKKITTASSQAYAHRNAVDMSYNRFLSKHEKNPWLRLNLQDSYFIYEIILKAPNCCEEHLGENLEIRVGNGLENNGNSNPICVSSFNLFPLEKKSVYCDMVGQYVNILRYVEKSALTFAEVIVNPETTDNVAAHKKGLSNTANYGYKGANLLTDLYIYTCFNSKSIDQLKWIWIRLVSTFVISKIYIANNPRSLDNLFDFDIKVGSCSVKTTSDKCCAFPFKYKNKLHYSCLITTTYPWCGCAGYPDSKSWGYCKTEIFENYESSPYCLPGLQDMRGIQTASFFCEPRVSGDHVYIKQHRTDKELSICEIAIYEEAEATIVNRKTDRHVWTVPNKNLTLTCDAKGYPAPVVTWVKDGAVIQNSSSTLEVKSSNCSEKYECWANNTHGVDVKYFDLIVSSNLRVCVDSVELKHDIENELGSQLNGGEWYKFYDAKRQRFLQFFEQAPNPNSSCQIWLNGGHPTIQDGVVSCSLCVKNKSHDCWATIDAHIRTCADYYIYNIKYSRLLINSKFCFTNGPNNPGGVKPMMAFPVANYALSQNVLHVETEILESYKCLGMCQLEPRCKSVNFSKKLKLCELNTATKKDFPGNYRWNENYDYYHMGRGTNIAVNGEL